MPNNVDLGASHIAFFVDDIRAAAQSLKEHGAELLRGPIQAQGDIKKGEEVWYFKTPWGAFMEILWRPYRLGYEKDTANRIFQPHDKWLDRALARRSGSQNICTDNDRRRKLSFGGTWIYSRRFAEVA